jgi:hypothetical protein
MVSFMDVLYLAAGQAAVISGIVLSDSGRLPATAGRSSARGSVGLVVEVLAVRVFFGSHCGACAASRGGSSHESGKRWDADRRRGRSRTDIGGAVSRTTVSAEASATGAKAFTWGASGAGPFTIRTNPCSHT